jgi:hypothetical protein
MQLLKSASRLSCNSASRADESIPSRRHRAKLPAKERSKGFPCCTSLVRESRIGLHDSPYSRTKQHDRSGEDGCPVTLDHFAAACGRARHVGCKRICAVIRRKCTLRLFRADICPSSMDAIAVEVAWPGGHHGKDEYC